MERKYSLAVELISRGKYKKALLVIKKLNNSTNLEAANTVLLEARCLYELKKYRQAIFKFENALKFNCTEEQKKLAYKYLASSHECLGESYAAINTLKQLLELENPLSSVDDRFALINIAEKVGDFESIQNYAPVLINNSEYAISALLLLYRSAEHGSDKELAKSYLLKTVAELKVAGRSKSTTDNIKELLYSLHTMELFKEEKDILSLFNAQYSNEIWYQQASAKKKITVGKSTGNHTFLAPICSSVEFKTSSNKLIQSEDNKVKQALNSLINELKKMGAKISDSLMIVESSGDISVFSKFQHTQTEVVLDIPLSCVPLYEDYKFFLTDCERINVTPLSKMKNPHAKNVMVLMCQLFDATNKLSHWKETYPLFLMAGFYNIFDKLLSAKSNGESFKKFYLSNPNVIPEDLLLLSFFQSRVMSQSKSAFRKLGVKLKDGDNWGFLPILDLVNHKMGESGFIIGQNNIQIGSGIGPSKRELFVQYSLDDPLITFLTYGFVDVSFRWVYTIKCELKTKTGLSIRVDNRSQRINIEDLPENLHHLLEYFPSDLVRQGKTVMVSKLVIPSNHQVGYLRDVLKCILKSFDFEGIYSNASVLFVEVDFLEKQIIEINLRYWNDLKIMVEKQQTTIKQMPPLVFDQLICLCNVYLEHINEYKRKVGSTAITKN